MKKLLLISSVFTVSLFALNCNKNDEVPPQPTDQLTKSPWKFSSAKASGVDVTAQIPSCFKDNTMLFVANGSGNINEGSEACVPPAPSTFTWYFQNNGTQLNLSASIISGGSGIFDINTLNDVNLVLSQNMIIPPSSTAVNVQITFIH